MNNCIKCGGKGRMITEHDRDGFGVFNFIKCSNCGTESQHHFASSGNDCPLYYQEVRDSWGEMNDKGRI